MCAQVETETGLTSTIEDEIGSLSSKWRSTKGETKNTDEFLDGIEKHKDQFYRFVKRTVWDQGVVEDVFSSAVLAAYENRHKYCASQIFVRIDMIELTAAAVRGSKTHRIILEDLLATEKLDFGTQMTTENLALRRDWRVPMDAG